MIYTLYLRELRLYEKYDEHPTILFRDSHATILRSVLLLGRRKENAVSMWSCVTLRRLSIAVCLYIFIYSVLRSNVLHSVTEMDFQK